MSEKLDIVLCCSAGMSTSLVVEKMQDAAKEKGIDAEIKAVPVSSVEDLDRSHKIDILLLGPQVKFKRTEGSLQRPKYPRRCHKYDRLRND